MSIHKLTSPVDRSAINESELDFYGDYSIKLPHIKSNFVRLVVVHPQYRCHGEDVEENYRKLNAGINLCVECSIRMLDAYQLLSCRFHLPEMLGTAKCTKAPRKRQSPKITTSLPRTKTLPQI